MGGTRASADRHDSGYACARNVEGHRDNGKVRLSVDKRGSAERRTMSFYVTKLEWRTTMEALGRALSRARRYRKGYERQRKRAQRLRARMGKVA
jgi:hypothetical protein